MLETHLRQAATVILESAIRIAPPDADDWGKAMRSEMDYVEGHWAAVIWALGGASVLVKRALASLFAPGRLPSGAGLFTKDVSVRKAVLATSGGCILLSLLFLLAPPFRQALRLSLRPWYWAIQGTPNFSQPGLKALARRADQKHDAEGLAFCAVRLHNSAETARLAKEAVRLDPNLLWVYAVVAVRHPGLPEIRQWVPQLEQWDPQNALFPMITAEDNDIGRSLRGDVQTLGHEKDPVWRSAMAGVFRSPKFDDYQDRLQELDRRVVARYGFYDPEEVLFEADSGVPSYAEQDFRIFAISLIHSGEDLEAQGDREGARDKYWAVARFGQLLDSPGHADFDRLDGAALQAKAYKQLEALSQKEGNEAEAALFGYLAVKFDPASGANAWRGQWTFGLDICKRNAAVLMISGLMILIFCALLVATASILIAGSRREAGHAAQTAKPAATLVAMISGVGLLFSSAALYLTYRPYWYLFQGVILNGDRSQARDLRAFLNSTRMIFGLQLGLSPQSQAYFWAGVILLGVIGLTLILLRHFGGRTRADGLQHSPRVP
ncbi:MAG TPA: hypothetical protein VKM93_10405 [Terriglobia bacterium]|nr:hypothetical protein [Terriglobia bacterium]